MIKVFQIETVNFDIIYFKKLKEKVICMECWQNNGDPKKDILSKIFLEKEDLVQLRKIFKHLLNK